MAITKVGAMTDPPVAGDYTILQAKLDAYAKQIGNQGMILTQWTNTTTAPKIAMGSYITHGGTLFVVDTEDFVVAAPGNGTYYLRVAASGASLAVSWVASLAGYTWNAIYNGLYDGSENQILPYMLIKSGATLEKWKITNLMQGGGFNRVDYLGRVVGGALTCTSVDTGSGPMTFDQGVKKADSPEFAELSVGGVSMRRVSYVYVPGGSSYKRLETMWAGDVFVISLAPDREGINDGTELYLPNDTGKYYCMGRFTVDSVVKGVNNGTPDAWYLIDGGTKIATSTTGGNPHDGTIIVVRML